MFLQIQTWIDRKRREKIKNRLSKDYRWEKQLAGRKNKKGRAIGEMLMGIRRNVEISKKEREREGKRRDNDKKSEDREGE